MRSDTKSETWKGFVAGSIAAIIAGGVTHPIDLIKVRLQIDNINARNMARTGMHIIKKDGVCGLYQGLSASVMRQASFVGVKFGVYDILTNYIKNSNEGKISFIEKTGSGLLAGAIGACIGNPFDLVMVRMQADGGLPPTMRRRYQNGLHALASVISKEGVFTLWRGCAPTVWRGMVVTSSQLAVYDHTKENLAKFGMPETPVLHISSSIIAGIVASLASNPIDLVKSRLMNMKTDHGGKLPYFGTIDCLVKTVKHEGVFALYKGLSATLCRQVPLNIIRFVSLEKLKMLLNA